MKRLLISLLLLATVTSARAEAPSKKFQLAVILPLSGQVSSLGTYVKHGIDLAYEALPPEKRALVEISYQDDQFDPAKTVTAYRAQKEAGRADGVFVIASPPANALSPIIERDRTVMMAIGASDPTIVLGKKYSFIHWVIPPVLGETLADELARRDLKRIGFICAEATGTIADMDAALAALQKRGLSDRVVYRQTFTKEDTDYRSAISQLRAKKADAVVAVLFPGALSSFAKQFRAAQLTAELVGIETFEDESEVKAADGALNGGWYANASDPSPEFVSRYQAKYHEHPGWAAGNGYDALMLLVDAVAANGHDSDKIAASLSGVKDYSGACGKYSASGDHRFTLPAALKRVTPSGFEPLPN